MSDKPTEENFWTQIEKDGGFKLGELNVITARTNVGKSMLTEDSFAFLYMLDPHYKDQSQTLTTHAVKKRDYNGEQLTFDFNTGTTLND